MQTYLLDGFLYGFLYADYKSGLRPITVFNRLHSQHHVLQFVGYQDTLVHKHGQLAWQLNDSTRLEFMFHRLLLADKIIS